MSTIGRTVRITGSVHASEDLIVEGRIDGPMACEASSITVASTGSVAGDVIAREVVIQGQSTGQLVATEIVEIEAGGNVRGQIVSPKLVVVDGATVNARVEPQHLEAALRVAKFRQGQKPAE